MKEQKPVSEKVSLRFLEILDGLCKKENVLRELVAAKRSGLLQEGIAEKDVQDRLIKSYVNGAILRSVSSGVVSALPWGLPVIGAIPAFILMVSANTLYVFKNELELCYLIAIASNSELTGEALKIRAFWLVGLSDYDKIKIQAKKIGVDITVKKLVEKLAVVSLSRGMGHFFYCGLAESMGMGIDKRLGFFIGTPISGFYGYRSTKGVAKRAIEYFRA